MANQVTAPEVRVICGHSGGEGGKWEEVQAIQHEPFIFVQYNGSFNGKGLDNIAELIRMLDTYRLDTYWDRTCITVNPCTGVRNPDWIHGDDAKEQFIDGPRMYECEGVVDFGGNFKNYSHAFCIQTNHQPTIDALTKAIEANKTEPRQ